MKREPKWLQAYGRWIEWSMSSGWRGLLCFILAFNIVVLTLTALALWAFMNVLNISGWG